jgi:hypothetical protein
MNTERRIQRLRKCAKHIATQSHLDKIIASFPEENRTALMEEIRPQLKLKSPDKDAATPRPTEQFNI